VQTVYPSDVIPHAAFLKLPCEMDHRLTPYSYRWFVPRVSAAECCRINRYIITNAKYPYNFFSCWRYLANSNQATRYVVTPFVRYSGLSGKEGDSLYKILIKFLDAFEKLRKTVVSFVTSARPSICPRFRIEQFASH